MAGFLELPKRSAKPREQGITHVLDRGLAAADIDDMVEVSGSSIDIVKLGWGTAVATGNLERKLERYRHYGLPVVLGGTLTEVAISQGRLDRLVAWVRELGLRHIEISDGTIALDHGRKVELIERLAQEFIVLSEVGSKDDTGAITPPYQWVQQMRAELAAGAWKVIAEGREAGTAGIFRPTGEVREGLIGEIVHEIDHARIMFDAPHKHQQVWFLRRFGSEVNLSNIAADDVLGVETLRLGLRSDTLGIGQ
ncbi:MAG: phosphosulfolactate synthase [Solirubrobacterales bacterium]|nr:phosphosulfolactate synthase [Solirubrobacterales bacterium]MBV9165777.1 phosphosulfolactate synthase [Solirubrobacterales bacterium]